MAIWRKGEVVVLNWLEDRLGGKEYQLVAYIKALSLLVLCRCAFNRVIWVRHNAKPHKSVNSFLYTSLIFFLKNISHACVTHREVEGINSLYVPHPLYYVNRIGVGKDSHVNYLIFGRIEKYKGIVELLEVWPSDSQLRILGRSVDKKLTDEILEVISRRRLNVIWKNEFIDSIELGAEIESSKCVVIPNSSETMYVSGVFFHALSFNKPVLVRNGNFYRCYLEKFGCFGSFELDSLKEDVENYDVESVEGGVRRAAAMHNDSECFRYWFKVISSGETDSIG